MLIEINHHSIYKSNYRRRDAKSIPSGFLQNNSASVNKINFTKPLSESVKTQVSFKGFNLGQVLNPTVETISQKLLQKTFSTLSEISSEQKELYIKYIQSFTSLVKNNPGFRKKIGLSDELARELSDDNIIKIPRQNLLKQFFSTIISPITAAKDLLLRLFDNKMGQSVFPGLYRHIQHTKDTEKVVNNYKKVLGLTDYIQIKENQYRLTTGHRHWGANDEFVMPKELLQAKVKLSRLGTVNPEKGQYSSRDVMLGNRLVSGSVYATFLANDAYNTTMKYSNDEKASKEQGNSRVKQEVAKIALNMYIYNILLTLCERKINKSLFNALLMGGITVASAEIMGRMLVGRPIFPSDKHTLDRLDAEMQNKTGILPAIGRMISSNKTNKNTEKSNEKDKNCEKVKANYSPSFKGGGTQALKLFEAKGLCALLNIVKKADEKTFAEVERTVLKNLSKIDEYKAKITPQTTLTELLRRSDVPQIPIGQAENIQDKVIKGILSPIHFIKGVSSGLKKLAEHAYHSLKGDKVKFLHDTNLAKIKKMGLDDEFGQYLQKRLSEEAWATSPHTMEYKELHILNEFIENQNTKKQELTGAANLILVLERKFKQGGVNLNNPSQEDILKAKGILNDILTKADSANHAEYDANKLAQANINLARAITTIFLVTDAYNLAIQYSDNNRKEAVKSAKNRTAQEVSRIATSAYIMAFFHKILSSFCNGSLLGAWATTAITSTASDSLARTVVGVPITRKTQDELHEIEKKNERSKNPVQKLLAYLIGKRTS